MIEPGERFEVEHDGVTFQASCLTRSQQRRAIAILNQLSDLEESTESISKVYDLADALLELCVPGLPEEQKELMSNEDIFAVAGKVIGAHVIGKETKKKSVSRHSSAVVNSAEVAQPDVFVTT